MSRAAADHNDNSDIDSETAISLSSNDSQINTYYEPEVLTGSQSQFAAERLANNSGAQNHSRSTAVSESEPQDLSYSRANTAETSSNSDQVEPYQREDSLSRTSSILGFLSRTGSRTGLRSRAGSRVDSKLDGDKNSDNQSETAADDNFTRKRRRASSVVNSFFTKELSDSETLESDKRTIHNKIQEPDFGGALQIKKTLFSDDEEKKLSQNRKHSLQNESGNHDNAIEDDSSENSDQGDHVDEDSVSRLSRYDTLINENEEEMRKLPVLEKIRRMSTIQYVSDKLNFWDKGFKTYRVKTFVSLSFVLFGMMLLFTLVISIYTGAYYDRTSRYRNLTFYIINEDDKVVNGIEPLIGNTITNIGKDPTTLLIGNWEPMNMTDFRSIASKNNRTVLQETINYVKLNKCWGAVHIPENSTARYVQSIVEGSSDSNIGSKNESDIILYYETARDFLAESAYIFSLRTAFVDKYLNSIPQNVSYPVLNKYISENALRSILISKISLNSIVSPPKIKMYDLVPVTTVMITPVLQLGMVYILLFAFFGFAISSKIHAYVSGKVKGKKFIVYRMLTSQSIYIVLGLTYSSLNAIFDVPFYAAFGKAGFLVLWAITYLAVNAVGTINESVAMICFSIFPPTIGPWLLTWTVLNISPTFSIIPLCPIFYRYGYAMPIHNFYECLKVIFCNGYKGNLGLNIGILLAWAALGNILVPIVQIFVRERMKKKALKK